MPWLLNRHGIRYLLVSHTVTPTYGYVIVVLVWSGYGLYPVPRPDFQTLLPSRTLLPHTNSQ